MKNSSAFMIILLLAHSAWAFPRVAVVKPHDCDQRANSLNDQTQNFRDLVHKVALVGEENGRKVSNDPTTKEAQLAEATGFGQACGKYAGSLNLVELDGEKYLIGSAHTFYKNGKLKCEEGVGHWTPDQQYDDTGINSKFGIDPYKAYSFELPPLNKSNALKKTLPHAYSSGKSKDFVILRITDQSALTRQLGGDRLALKLSTDTTRDIVNQTDFSSTHFVSARKNFNNRGTVSYQRGCVIGKAKKNPHLLRHNCDTGKGSSGGALIYDDQSNAATALGFHIGGKAVSDELFEQQNRTGNFFVPAHLVAEEIRALKND